MAGSMTGMTEEEYRDMMVKRRPARIERQPHHDRGEEVMARITASVYTSHVPAIGAALDLGKTARALLAAGVRGLRLLQAMDEGAASPT